MKFLSVRKKKTVFDKQSLTPVINKHISVYGLLPAFDMKPQDLPITERTERALAILCRNSQKSISQWRHDLVHSVRQENLITAPHDLNDLLP